MNFSSKRLRLVTLFTCLTVVTFLGMIKLDYLKTEHILQVVEEANWVSNSTHSINNATEVIYNKDKNSTHKQFQSILESYIVNDSKLFNLAKQAPHIDFKSYNKDRKYFRSRKRVDIVNCRSIFNENRKEIRRAEDVSKTVSRVGISSKDYIRMTKNCERFIKERGYITDPLTKEEQGFPIAYSMLMYKSTEQAERLLRAIYRPQNIYCIHVDAKTKPGIYRAISDIANCFENVFISRRVDVIWGHFTVLVPELLCMQELVRRNKKWKYFINLTGQEFPLKTNADIVSILKAYGGSNDIDSYTSREIDRRVKDAGDAPHGVVVKKGMVHMAVTREFVEYTQHDQKSIDILQWSTKALHSEELYFATLHGNRHLNAPGSPTDDRQLNVLPAARYKLWDVGRPCHGKYVRNICIFGIGDLPKLATRFEMFANKFFINFSPLTYECIEEWHYNRTRDQYFGKLKFDTSKYRDGGYYTNDFLFPMR